MSESTIYLVFKIPSNPLDFIVNLIKAIPMSSMMTDQIKKNQNLIDSKIKYSELLQDHREDQISSAKLFKDRFPESPLIGGCNFTIDNYFLIRFGGVNYSPKEEDIWGSHGSSGSRILPGSQIDFFDTGFFFVRLEIYLLSDKTPDGLVLKNYEYEKRYLKRLISKLNPYYTFFSTGQNEELVYYMDDESRIINSWIPVNPWKYLWNNFVFGKELVNQYGREKILSTPAQEVEIFGDGMAWFQSSYIYIDSLNSFIINIPLTAMNKFERREFFTQHKMRIREMLRHLDLINPFSNLIDIDL